MNEKLRGIKASKLPLGYSALGPRQRNMFGAKDETGAPAKTVFTTRDLIVNSLAKSLPSVTKELAEYCSKEKKFNWKQGNLLVFLKKKNILTTKYVSSNYYHLILTQEKKLGTRR